MCVLGKWISILDHELGGSKTYFAPADTCFASASGKTVTPLSMSDLFFSSASHDYPKATV